MTKRTRSVKGCAWEYNETDDFYETKCENGWTFETGGVKENGVKFCPFCGRKVKEKKI